ncbi:MAG: HAMP domain-containing histidine kinase, partial [Anaerolineales bacterium]|nr:HAMP domain-containing histidine kinase [Anaerolineales bacterium]
MNNDSEEPTKTERLLHYIITRFDRPSKLVLASAITAVPTTWFIVYVADVPFEWLIGAPLIALFGSVTSTYIVSKTLFAFQERIQKQNKILQAQAAALQEANAELDAFASTVAHDLKTPLSTIAGYTNLLSSEWSDLSPAEIKQILEMVDKSAHNMSNIVDEILLFARARHDEAIDLSPLDMHQIVKRALERLHDEVQRCAAEIILPDSWPAAVGYAPWVEEIWTNYLSNGLKYGGHPPRLELGAAVEHDQIRFWVT